MPMLILNSRSNSIVGSWQESSIMAENEVLFQKGSRNKYCRGVNGCVILLTYSVLGCCHSAVSHFKSVIARYGKAICLTFSWLTKVFTTLQNIVGTKSVSNDRFGNKNSPRRRVYGQGLLFCTCLSERRITSCRRSGSRRSCPSRRG